MFGLRSLKALFVQFHLKTKLLKCVYFLVNSTMQPNSLLILKLIQGVSKVWKLPNNIVIEELWNMELTKYSNTIITDFLCRCKFFEPHGVEFSPQGLC